MMRGGERFAWTGHQQVEEEFSKRLQQVLAGAFDPHAITEAAYTQQTAHPRQAEALVIRLRGTVDPSVLQELYQVAWQLGERDATQLLRKALPAHLPPGLQRLIHGARHIFDGILATITGRISTVVAEHVTASQQAEPAWPTTEPVEWPTADPDTPAPSTPEPKWPKKDLDALETAITDVIYNPRHVTNVTTTEATRAMTAAAYHVYSEFGTQQVRFITAEDAKVCPLCDANEAQGAIPLTANFINGAPPVHPRCRCAVIPSWDDLDPIVNHGSY